MKNKRCSFTFITPEPGLLWPFSLSNLNIWLAFSEEGLLTKNIVPHRAKADNAVLCPNSKLSPCNLQQHISSCREKSARFPSHITPMYLLWRRKGDVIPVWVLTSTRCLHSGFAGDFLSVWGVWIRMMSTSQVQFLDHLRWTHLEKGTPHWGDLFYNYPNPLPHTL